MMTPLLSAGFRPFFLLASLFAALVVPAWDLVLRGRLPLTTHLGPFGWHAHEMLFGFTAAVLAGFLLTAARNWTGRETARGPLLFALVLLWLAGRAAPLFDTALPPALVVAPDPLFFLAVALVVGVPILRSRNLRNAPLPLLLLVLGAADLTLHLAALGTAPTLGPVAKAVALHVPMVFLTVIGGRVIPAFTGNALRADGVELRSRNVVDALAPAAAVSVLVFEAWVALRPSLAIAAATAAGFAGLVVLARMRGWRSAAVRGQPILWVLHLGYLLLGTGYLALAASRLWPAALPPTTALHTLTVGALGLLILGMMSRVALGHTGRPLVVRPIIVVAYLLLGLALVARVVVPALWPAAAFVGIDVAATAWMVAFGSYFVVYLPILVGPRADAPPPAPGLVPLSPGHTATS